jgi:hypothetical protein
LTAGVELSPHTYNINGIGVTGVGGWGVAPMIFTFQVTKLMISKKKKSSYRRDVFSHCHIGIKFVHVEIVGPI